MCVNCVCSFRPSSTLRSGIRRLTWRIRIWFGTSGVCVLNRCTRYDCRRNPLLHFHVPVECLAHDDLCVCAGVFSVQRSGNSWWPPSYERIRIAHLQTGQRSGTVGVLQVPLQGTYCLFVCLQNLQLKVTKSQPIRTDLMFNWGDMAKNRT